MQVIVSTELAEGFQEYRDTIESYTDPENPDALIDFLAGFRSEIMGNTGLAEEFPHYLALALHDQIKFAKEYPEITWLSDLDCVSWDSMKPHLRANDTGKKICACFEESNLEVLEAAIKILLLSTNFKKIQIETEEDI